MMLNYDHMLSNNGLLLHTPVQYVLLFLVLVVNSDKLEILRSCTLLLKLSVLMCSWFNLWMDLA